MDAIILAGGKGTRLRSLIPDLPKPLAPINGIPFIDILLKQLNRCKSIHQVILAIGYRGELIRAEYQKRTDFGFGIKFSEESKLLGTGGAIKKAIALSSSKYTLVQNGDTFVGIDFEKLIDFQKTNHAPLTIVLTEVTNTERFGSVQIDSSHNIIAFKEKQQSRGPGFINAGIYIFQNDLFNNIRVDKIVSLEKDLLPAWIKMGAKAFVTDDKFIDIGIPETYRKAGEYLKEV